jgi:hypothetical protein
MTAHKIWHSSSRVRRPSVARRGEPQVWRRSALAGNTYDVDFSFIHRTERGNARTSATVTILDSAKVLPHNYGFIFLSSTSVYVLDLTTSTDVGSNPKFYRSGLNYDLQARVLRARFTDPDPTATEYVPQAGDYFTINFAVRTVRNGTDTVIAPRRFVPERDQAPSDGVAFTFTPAPLIRSVERTAGSDNFTATFSVSRRDSIKTNRYTITTTGGGTNTEGTAFVSLRVTDTVNTVIAMVDTAYSMSTFEFRGVLVRVEFAGHPGADNTYVISTLAPLAPSVRDRYRITLAGPTIDVQQVAHEINTIRVVPNPYIVSSLYEPEFGELRREPLKQIQFTNLPPECTITIFTMDANRVKTLRHDASNGTEIWDLRSESGREVAPGLYLFVVKTEGAEYRGRFAIIK